MTAAYATSTAGLIALTKSLGKELAQEGVLVNAVTPSASETEIFGTLTAERRAQLLERVPMQRFLDPSEVSALAAWLVSAECSFPQTLRSTYPAGAPLGEYALMLLDEKVAIVTGAAKAREIGLATAQLFAAHGARVALLD
jgi:NAD(P)-dependent dehydrogenase (short-subunit alcohol dehydrogenase family)